MIGINGFRVVKLLVRFMVILRISKVTTFNQNLNKATTFSLYFLKTLKFISLVLNATIFSQNINKIANLRPFKSIHSKSLLKNSLVNILYATTKTNQIISHIFLAKLVIFQFIIFKHKN